MVGVLVASKTTNAAVYEGPSTTEYDALLVSSTSARTVLFGTEHGLFRTTNGGRTWLPAGLTDTSVTSLARSGSTILAAGSDLFASSTNGGRTWKRIHPRGLPNDEIDALAAYSSTVYVVLRTGGLFRSVNGGRSFSVITFMVGPAIRSLAATRTTILAGDVVGGVWISHNGGSWRHTAGGMVMDLAVNPVNQHQVLVASYGVSRSVDGGLRWTSAVSSTSMFGAVAWAPQAPSLAYAVSDNRTFWRSSNGGASWIRVTR